MFKIPYRRELTRRAIEEGLFEDIRGRRSVEEYHPPDHDPLYVLMERGHLQSTEAKVEKCRTPYLSAANLYMAGVKVSLLGMIEGLDHATDIQVTAIRLSSGPNELMDQQLCPVVALNDTPGFTFFFPVSCHHRFLYINAGNERYFLERTPDGVHCVYCPPLIPKAVYEDEPLPARFLKGDVITPDEYSSAMQPAPEVTDQPECQCLACRMKRMILEGPDPDTVLGPVSLEKAE